MIEYLEKCKVGKHEYVTIYDGSSIWSNDLDLMIYWCKNCGSTRGCLENDGRFYRQVFFKVPKVSVETQKGENERPA